MSSLVQPQEGHHAARRQDRARPRPADARRRRALHLSILAIQSTVAYGHVGNAAAVFPLQRLGMEVWSVNTVQFSNHPGYGAFQGQVATGEAIRALIDGIAARNVLAQCDAVLSGYLGDAAIGEAVLHAAALARAANPAALYCCDPVIGDTAPGVYVRPGIPAFLRDHGVPSADIATPNQFELAHLTGLPVATLDGAKAAARALLATMRPGAVLLVTGLLTAETPDGQIDMLAASSAGFHRLRTPRLALAASGAGDTIAALFLFHFLRTRDPADALAAAGSAVFGLLHRTAAAGSRELLTIAAQDEFVTPGKIFVPEPC